jgi:hypothetical protein
MTLSESLRWVFGPVTVLNLNPRPLGLKPIMDEVVRWLRTRRHSGIRRPATARPHDPKHGCCPDDVQ